jgi:ribonucleoside-triphosphate reductase
MEGVKTTKKVRPKLYVSGDSESRKVFLTSGFQAPFQEGDLLKQLDVNSHFQSYATGGSIFHLFTAEEMTPEQQEKLIFGIIKNFPIQYLTKTPFLSSCNECGYKMVGKRNKCEKCGGTDITVWSRPIGYFRPVMRGKISKDYRQAQYIFWLSGRIEDFATRKEVTKKDIEEILEEIQSGV